ncbi:putative GATA transcription factor 22 [Salvia splendens]|uniref:putative GATA transcription factor 22 n=1 Tax=Salvia splendens TaxID=180675 RepID=UPI001C25C001|nr:putative GATA transcription factor 22 [Salvia splendens]
MSLNLSPCLSPVEQTEYNVEKHDEQHQIVSSSAPFRVFFNPSEDHHMGFYQYPHLYQPQVEYYGCHRGSSSCYTMENNVENGVKWISSKSKKLDAAKIEVKKVMMASSDLNLSYNPIRVCSDCHTTKTPLWRSGPKGPKSLCNACGIRQRKARRAMAAAATNVGVAPPLPMKVKAKRCKVGGGGSSTSNSNGRKMEFEDFLINLSNKLALIHRVFPQDEKEAAILLMAISSGHVHG